MWSIADPGRAGGDAANQAGAFRLARDELRRHLLTEVLATGRPAPGV